MNAELQKVINETIKENPAVAIIMKLAVELQEENGRLRKEVERGKIVKEHYKELCILYGKNAYIPETN